MAGTLYFYIDDNTTAADMMDKDKDALFMINHRGKAAKQMINNILKEYYHETAN